MPIVNINVKLPKFANFMFLIQITGLRVTVADVAPLQYQQVLRQLSLKYYQVVVLVDHRVVTSITELADRAATTAQER
jgi:hypothetical protein